MGIERSEVQRYFEWREIHAAGDLMAQEDIVRKLLEEIDKNPEVSQKALAKSLGISAGAINWHVRRCVAKGLVKLSKAPIRRYLYYLTPDGFAEKAELTSRYLKTSLRIFRIGREQYGTIFAYCERSGYTKVALLGQSELSDLACMVAAEHPQIEILGILCLDCRNEIPSTFEAPFADADAFIVTHFLTKDCTVERDLEWLTLRGVDADRLFVPDFMR